MPRGFDTSKGRDIGPGSDLHARIAAETASQRHMFGTVVGTQDDGKYTQKRPLPGTAVGTETYFGAPESRPSFAGADHMAIQLAQMEENHASAMAGLMQPPPDHAPMNNIKMQDRGFRESDGVEHPVHSYVDERIKIKPKD